MLLGPGLEIGSTATLVIGPILVALEGMFWALLSGAVLAFPLAVLAFAFRPPHTAAAVLVVSALLLVPILAIDFPADAIDGLVLVLAVCVGVHVGLRALSRPVHDTDAPRRDPEQDLR